MSLLENGSLVRNIHAGRVKKLSRRVYEILERWHRILISQFNQRYLHKTGFRGMDAHIASRRNSLKDELRSIEKKISLQAKLIMRLRKQKSDVEAALNMMFVLNQQRLVFMLVLEAVGNLNNSCRYGTA